MKLFLCVVLFGFSLLTIAEDLAEPLGNGDFLGTLGGKPAVLHLNQNYKSDEITGLRLGGDHIALSGKLLPDGTLVLAEQISGHTNEGVWEGKLTEGKFTGNWKLKNGGVGTPFNLERKWYATGHYRGQLGEKLEITVWLNGFDKISGRYFYNNKALEIPLQGKLETDGKIEIEERDAAGTVTGLWHAHMERMGKGIYGEWVSPNGKVKLPISLTWTGDNESSYAYDFQGLANTKAGVTTRSVSCLDKPTDSTCQCTISVGWGSKELDGPDALPRPVADLARKFIDEKVNPFADKLCNSTMKETDGKRRVLVEGFVRQDLAPYLSIIFREYQSGDAVAVNYKMPEGKVVLLDQVVNQKSQKKIIDFMKRKTGATLKIPKDQSFSIAPSLDYEALRLTLYYDKAFTTKLVNEQNKFSSARTISDEEEAIMENIEAPEISDGKVSIPPNYITDPVLKKAYLSAKKQS